jgi:subtilisin family serine protease
MHHGAGLALALVALAPGPAAALGLDSTRPPVPLDGDRWRFSGPDGATADWQVLPAVVLHAEPGAVLPEGARTLGGRSYLLDVSSPAEAVARSLELAGRPGLTVMPDLVLDKRVAALTDDPHRGGQWYLDDLDMDSLHALSLGDAEVRVAVIDSGIAVDHPDLVDGILAPYDAHSDDEDPSPDPGEYCPSGGSGICDEHGTAVSGVVAARADNGVDIVGMCPSCTLVPIKMLGEGSGAMSADIAAFEHAIAQDVAVINNSWGYVRPTAVPEPLAEVIRRASTETRDGRGALVVFAAGNDNREVQDDELQALGEVLCVSATDAYGNPTNYTNFGGPIDLAAPSATVSITPSGELTTSFGGTSAAAPVAAGLAAWAVSVDPTLTAAELHALLVDTAAPSPLVTHDETGHHPYYGYGELDALEVLAVLTRDEEGPAEPGDSGAPDLDDEGADGTEAEDDDPKGGCAAVGGGASWLGLLVAGLVLRRRRGVRAVA